MGAGSICSRPYMCAVFIILLKLNNFSMLMLIIMKAHTKKSATAEPLISGAGSICRRPCNPA